MLASTAVAVALILTRPDFEGWYLVPPLLAGGGGTIIIQIGGRRRRQSQMLDIVDDEIEARRRRWKFQKEVDSHQSRPMRWFAIIMALFIVVPTVAIIVSSPETIEVIERWKGVFGCEC